MNEIIKHKIKHNVHRAVVSVKWMIFAVIVGVIVGLCGTAFYFGLSLVTVLRAQYHWLLFLSGFIHNFVVYIFFISSSCIRFAFLAC